MFGNDLTKIWYSLTWPQRLSNTQLSPNLNDVTGEEGFVAGGPHLFLRERGAVQWPRFSPVWGSKIRQISV